VVGKDITRFHAIYWPIMLKCLNLRMPSHILSHGFIMAEDGRKMSKSFNNVIDPVEIIKEYGSDIVRYYLAKEFIIANDNHFSKKKLVELFNSDLANIYGNLVSRFLGMINKYTNGVIVKPDLTKLSANTTHTVAAMESLLDKCPQFINSYNLSGLLANILEIGKIANTYVELTKP
jgi:methionyl-tRNA synthetase